MTNIQPFTFPTTGQQVRAAQVGGEPWFVGRDAATILGHANPARAVRDHVPAGHRRVTDSVTPSELGLDPQTVLISEAGLYRLIMRSNTVMAHQFQEWVTAEVLPAIRRTGTYTAPDTPSPFEVPASFAEALELAARQAREIEANHRAIEALEPSATAWDTLADASGDYSVRDAAQQLSRDPHVTVGQNRLFSYLRRIRWIDGTGRPYQQQVEAGRLVRRPTSYEHPHTGEPVLTSQIRITPKGLAELHRRLILTGSRATVAAGDGSTQ